MKAVYKNTLHLNNPFCYTIAEFHNRSFDSVGVVVVDFFFFFGTVNFDIFFSTKTRALAVWRQEAW